MIGVTQVKAQASFNHTYKEGATVAAGEDYFLYNIGAGMFLTDGMDWGTHATADHAGRVITFAALEGGKYSIRTASYSVNNGEQAKEGFMTLNGYLDTGTNDANWEFTPVAVDGYTNVYTIKNSDTQYLHFNAEDCRVNVGESTNNNYSYWIIVPKTARDAVGDYTYYLMNTDFNRPWERVTWKIDGGFTNQAGGLSSNRCAEAYGHGFNLYQTIANSVPNGKYTLYNQAFYNNADAENQTYLYANNNQIAVAHLNEHGEGTEANMNGASTSFNAGYYVNSVSTVVTDGKLTIGLKNSSNAGNTWSIFDNFYLKFIGTCLVNDAVALPDGGAMTAGTWYYFDIPAAGDDYNATATTLGDIICTANGEQLTPSATGEITLKATENSFAKARYYVKSSSDNNLVVAASSYSYSVSEATADKAYIQPSNTVTVNFAVSTNDPSATLTQDYSGVTFDGVAINVTPGANGFTFTVPANLEAGVAHTLYIPANAIGYEAGSTYNAEQNIELNAVALYDGVYYMRNTYFNTYISRAGNYNTQAIQDKWGLAFKVSTDANNNTKLQYFDSELWLGDDGFCYGDCSGGRVRSFNVTKVDGGYKFLNTNNSKYLAVYDGQTVGDAAEGGNLQGTSNVWDLESTEAHVANYTANDNAQAAAAATAAGIEGITTKAALAAELAANYGETEINITGAKAEKYQVYPGSAQAAAPATYYSETVENLKPGLYKLSVAAFQRASTNDRVFAAGGARGLIYLYAGDAKTQLMSVSEYGSDTQYANTDYEHDGKYYPNREQTGYDALATGNFNNEVYVYVADAGSGTGSLEIGIQNPSRPGNNCQTWSVYNTWKLAYYEAKATPAEKAALADAIADAEAKTPGFEEGEYAPYNNQEAFAALAAAKAINPETASGEAVVNATTALTDATWTANTEEVNAVWDGSFEYDYRATTPSGNVNPYGWQRVKDAAADGYNVRYMDGSNAGLAATSSHKALFTKQSAYYGYADGYTMPLKANTLYKLTFVYGGWGDCKKDGYVSMTDPDGNAITLSVTDLPLDATDADANPESWKTYTAYFTTGEAGNYVLGLRKKDNDISGQSQYVYGDIVLKKSEGANLKVANGKLGTFVAPFNVVLPQNVKGYIAKVDGSEVKLTKIAEGGNELTAGTPVIVYADGADVDETFYGIPTEDWTLAKASDLWGILAESSKNVPVGAYVLQTQGGVQAFYKVTSVAPGALNRCYVKVTEPNQNARLTITFDGEDPTAINAIEAAEAEEGTLKDGKYFIDNKIVIVKNGVKYGANGQILK